MRKNKRASFFTITESKLYILLLVAFMSIPLFLYKINFITMALEGDSMFPTLKNETIILCNRVYNPYKEVERNEFVSIIAPDNENELYLKRVVGLPGEVIEIVSGDVYINGELLDSSFVENENFTTIPPTLLGEDEYYVMGDNRAFSLDSRNFGPIKADTIKCKYLVTVPIPSFIKNLVTK